MLAGVNMTRVRGGITKDNTDGDVNIDSMLKTNNSGQNLKISLLLLPMSFRC